MTQPKEKKPVVRIKPRDYQPNKADLEEDVSIDATADELARAVLTPVKIEYEKEESQSR